MGLTPATPASGSAPAGRSCRALERQLPPHGGLVAAPRGSSSPDSGRAADSGPQQDGGCRAPDILCGNNSVAIKTHWPCVRFSFFSPLCCHTNQRSEDRGKHSIWEARHINQHSHYKKALNGQCDASSLPHIKTILVLPLICSVACGKDDATPPVAKRSSAGSGSDFLASDRHAMPPKGE